jgi:hypothetical protein
MPNDKLRLNLADLRLKSFETTDRPAPARGTVRGMDQCGNCTFCSMNSCNWYSNGCYGASHTDSCNWDGTWGATACEGTCHDETCASTCTGPCPGGTCDLTCAATCQSC